MNLIQLALAADEFFQHQPNIRFDGQQCIRSKNKHADCQLCVNFCPTDAISLDGNIPQIDAESCIRCGVCLHACPVGAFERTDGTHDLLNCAETLVDHEVLDIACVYHPAPQKTERKVDAVIKTGNCLCELGPSAYVGLKALGVKQIRIRQDACSQCPLRVLQPHIEKSAHRAQQILSTVGIDHGITLVPDVKNTRRKKPVYPSNRPPISRRELFSMFTAPKPSCAQAITSIESQLKEDKHTSRERKRLLNALHILTESDLNMANDAILADEHFAQFLVEDTCTACGLCERACPVGAIKVDKTDTAFTINFSPSLCINCGLCTEFCEPEALKPSDSPSMHDVLEGAVMPLHTGPLRQCKRCKTLFTEQLEGDLCPNCRHRAQKASHTQLPDDVLAKLPEETRNRIRRLE